MKTNMRQNYKRNIAEIKELIEKEKNNNHMTMEQRRKCSKIIHGVSTLAGLACSGLAQIPLADNLVLAPLQMTLAISLGKIFGIALTKSTAEAAIASAAGYYIGRTATQLLWGWIPGLGNAINATTAAVLTELIGWTLASSFSWKSSSKVNIYV